MLFLTGLGLESVGTLVRARLVLALADYRKRARGVRRDRVLQSASRRCSHAVESLVRSTSPRLVCFPRFQIEASAAEAQGTRCCLKPNLWLLMAHAREASGAIKFYRGSRRLPSIDSELTIPFSSVWGSERRLPRYGVDADAAAAINRIGSGQTICARRHIGGQRCRR